MLGLNLVARTVVSAIWMLSLITACPDKCLCEVGSRGLSTTCNGGRLTAILAEISPDTVILNVHDATHGADMNSVNIEMIKSRQIYELSITRTTINTISDNTFSSLLNLLTLNLSRNNIVTISKGAFNGLGSLKVLDLSNNRIASITELFKPFNMLTDLDLSNNFLTSVQSGTFSRLRKLTRLLLNGNRLQVPHGYIFQGLISLKFLGLRRCGITKLSDDLFHPIHSIATLDLGDNAIFSLPSSGQFNNLPYLRFVYLDRNQIRLLNDHQFSGITLEILDLSGNKIQELNSMVFKYFNTKVLHLSYNSIRDISADAFKPMAPMLEDLTLAGNPLQKVANQALRGLYRLRTLNLSACAIESLSSELFQGMESLRVLDISWNSLQNLPLEVMENFGRLSSLSLHNNFWNCDCHIQPFQEWLQQYSNTVLVCTNAQNIIEDCVKPKCSSPNELHDKDIASLKQSELVQCQVSRVSSAMQTDVKIAIGVSVTLIILFVTIVLVLLIRHYDVCCFSDHGNSSHNDYEKKRRPFQDMDIGSLNESDRSFNVRNYFRSIDQNPNFSRSMPSIPSLNQTNHRDSESLNSKISFNTIASYPMGRESAV